MMDTPRRGLRSLRSVMLVSMLGGLLVVPSVSFRQPAVSVVMAAPQNIIQDGDIVVETFSNATATLESRHGSVTINQKIDDHSNLTIRAAKNVTIGQKIDQHSSADIVAGGSVDIGQKIDQHSVARIVAQTGNISIAQKVDQHSTAFLSAPAGNINIGQGIDQHSIVHYLAKGAQLGTFSSGGTADTNMNAPVDPNQ